MHGEKVGGVSGFVQQTHTLSEHYKRIFGNIDCFTMVKPVNGLCLETKQMWLKSCVTRNNDPVSNRGRFLSFKYSFSNFVFREIRLTDKVLYCIKIHNFSLICLRDLRLFLDEAFFS